MRQLKNWINSYLEYTANTESPERFHFWAAVSTVAGALARKCYLPRGLFTVFPNHYIVLVSESAWCRKTSATDIAMFQMLDKIGVPMLIEKLTPAFLSKHLGNLTAAGKDAAVTIYSPELSNFLGMSAVANGLVGMITTLYGSQEKWEARTKGCGEDIIRNVCVNILGATTMEWMGQHLPGDTVEGGITGRIIFVVSDEPRQRVAWPEMTPSLIKLRDILISDLVEITHIIGMFEKTEAAKQLYADWYNNAISEPEDARLRPYYGRKGDHVLKLAMILSVAESSNLIIDATHIDQSLAAFDDIEPLMRHAFRGVAFSKSSKDADRILRQIEKANGTFGHSALLKRNYVYLNAKEFEEVVRTLIDSKLISMTITNGAKVYKIVGKGE